MGHLLLYQCILHSHKLYRHKDIKYVFGGWDSCNCKAPDYGNPAHCAPVRTEGSYVTCAPLLGVTEGINGTNSANMCCDTYPDSTNNDLATSCGSNLQGSNRLQRGLNYISYLTRYYTSSEYDRIRAAYEANRSGVDGYISSTSRIYSGEYQPVHAVIEELQHDSPRFYTSDVVQRWLYSLPNTTTTTTTTINSSGTAQHTQPHNIFPIPLPVPLLDFSNVAFIALYVVVCLAVGAAISLVLRFHSQQRRRVLSWPPGSSRIGGSAQSNGSAPTEETYLLL